MDFSIREWRIIVGIFTATFIGVLWDRYESLKTVFDKYRLDTFTTNKKNLSYIPNDYDDLKVAIITPDKDIIPDAETLNPAFIVFDNYEIILQWNRSLRFALAVCSLKNKFGNEIQ